MRRYLVKIAFFSLIVVGVFGGLSAFLLRMELSAYARESRMPPDTVCAVCGDSQTELGLNPQLWPGFFNFSISAIQLDQIELKVIDLLERNPGRPKVLLIDISPRKLAAQDIDTPLVKDRGACKRFLLHVLHPKESRRSLDGVVVVFRDAILVKRLKKAYKCLRKGRPYVSSIGGPGSDASVRSEEDVSARRAAILARPTKLGFRDHLEQVMDGIEEHAAELNSWGLATEDSKSAKCIKAIVANVRSHGVVPVLITPPWHALLRERAAPGVLDNFRQVMREICRDCGGVTWLDYLELPFADEEWRDGNHLNSHGAVRFTECVRADVERILSQSESSDRCN